MNKAVPIAFFTTKILIIDDNKVFAETLSLELENNNIVNNFYLNPNCALDNIINNIDLFKNFKSELNNQHNNILNNQEFSLKNLVDSKYHDLFSVLIIDYDMPNINGIELCEKISALNIPVQKILLTGHEDKNIAIEAFNKNLINNYILKNTDNLITELLKIINNLQLNFFNKLLNPIYSAVNNLTNNLLENNNYKNLIKNYINNTNYHLLDDSGSMKINNKILHIADQSRMDSMKEIAEFNKIKLEDNKILVCNDNENIVCDCEKYENIYYCLI